MKYICSLSLIIIFTSCSEVKNYEKQYLNDPSMSLSNDEIESSEINFQTYREAASGANGGKNGGGCGCN